MNFYIPIAIIVLSNTFYHIIAKYTPSHVDTYASLAVTYLIGAITCLILFLITSKNRSLLNEIKQLNWTSFALGITIVGLEVGVLLMYRAGWNISVGSLVASTILAIVLIFVGILLFKEQVSIKQILGIILCLIGLIFINH